MKYDLTILTEAQYVAPKQLNAYIQNVLTEDQLLQEACEKLGMRVHRTSWDDPNMDWSETRFAIFRTTWDYFDRFDAFSAWLDTVETQTKLINSSALIRWNLDKRYLFELEHKGVRIPTGVYLEKGDKRSLATIIEELNWKTFILKPAVSGAARHTYLFSDDTAPQYESIFRELIESEHMILQEYQKQITTKGEISLMLFGGEYSHAVLKKAKPGDFRVQDDFGGTVHAYMPSDQAIRFAENALAQCPELPIYARVDLFWNNEDDLVLGELELIEPELWFREAAQSAELCALAIQRYIQQYSDKDLVDKL